MSDFPDILRGRSRYLMTKEELQAEDDALAHQAGKSVLVWNGLTGESRYVPAAGSIRRADRPRPK